MACTIPSHDNAPYANLAKRSRDTGTTPQRLAMTLDQFVRSTLVLSRRFFQWWGAELAACIPAGMRLETPWTRRSLVLLLGPREAVVGHERGDGRLEVDERLSLAGGPNRAARDRHVPVRLRLDIPLPAAALENLDEAVAFQLDRYTPFLPEQVYLACAAGERTAGTNVVPVSAVVVERRVVDDAVAEAQRCGFTVASVEVARGDMRDAAVDMLPVPELGACSLRQSVLTAAVVVLLLALSAAAAILPFAREEARADALRQQIAAARGRADTAQRLEKAIETQKAEASFLADRKRDRVSALEILAEVTRLAPDDTWLSSAEFSGTEVQISGVSASASDLIGRIDTSEIFHKAEFRSPVTPDQKTGHEHFAIAAQVGRRSAP
jgi:general secretion pathway protein L